MRALVVDPAPFERAAELLTRVIESVLVERGSVRLAIPGGSALEAAVRARSTLGDRWRSVSLTWVDERCVSFADPESNRGTAARSGLFEATASGDPEPGSARSPARVLPLFRDGESPPAAIARVEQALASGFGDALDVVLLGMGADGHVASLFPGRAEVWPGRVVHVADSPKPPSDRISLTRAFLATARHVILVAAGASKREALRRLLAGDEALPAHGLEGLVVVTDLGDIESGGDGNG